MYNLFSATHTTFTAIQEELWAGIFVGDALARLTLNRCTVNEIYTDPNSLHGSGIHFYGATDTLHSIKHSKIYRSKPGVNTHGGDGIFLQADFSQTPLVMSVVTIDSSCISENWFTGISNAGSFLNINGSRVFGNFQGIGTTNTAKSHLFENCIINNQARGLFGAYGAKFVLQPRYGASHGANTITENGPNHPNALQVNQAQIVVESGSVLNDANFTSSNGRNRISHTVDTVKRVYADSTQPQVFIQGNWFGEQPDGCTPMVLYGQLTPDQVSRFFTQSIPPVIEHGDALCDEPDVPDCDSACSSGTGAPRVYSPPFVSGDGTSSPGLALNKAAAPLNLRSTLRDASNLTRVGNLLPVYGLMDQVLSQFSQHGITSLVGRFLLHMELDRARRYPDSTSTCMSRLATFLSSRISSTSNNLRKAALREAFAHTYAYAHDIPAASQVVSTLRNTHGSTEYGRRILSLKQFLAMAQWDTVGVDQTISEMVSAGFSADALREARALRAGFLRMKKRSVTFTKLYLPDSAVSRPSNTQGNDVALRNYPNPFNPSTHIEYRLPSTQHVTIKVVSPLGKEICTIINEEKNAGWHSIDFDASRYQLASGVYFVTLSTKEKRLTRKILLAR